MGRSGIRILTGAVVSVIAAAVGCGDGATGGSGGTGASWGHESFDTGGSSSGAASGTGSAAGGVEGTGSAASGGSTGGEAGGDSGGSDGSGGTTGGGGPIGPCDRVATACTSPEVRVTESDVGVPVTPYGSEYDTQPIPSVIAALPSGGSRVAFRGTDGKVYVAELDCDDRLVGTPISFPAHDVQDIHADEEGGVLLVTRAATGSGTHGCGAGPLCGGTSAQCYGMYLLRFSEDGTEEWATQVTNLSASLEGYDSGARFVWGHYQHHGRIAFDGANYAAYFSIGITVQNGSCVDVHEGDRMQVVSSSGQPVSHGQAFQVGCSHSWTTRMVWDPRASKYMLLCATDNPDPATSSPCRIARPAPYRTIAPVQCAGAFWGGDLVLDDSNGYWTAYTQAGQMQLVHFTESGPDQTIANQGSSDHAKLVNYGEGRMLLAWQSGSSMAAQIYDSGSGAKIGAQFTIGVPDHNYHAFEEYADGSVAYPASGSNSTSLRIARVMPCQ